MDPIPLWRRSPFCHFYSQRTAHSLKLLGVPLKPQTAKHFVKAVQIFNASYTQFLQEIKTRVNGQYMVYSNSTSSLQIDVCSMFLPSWDLKFSAKMVEVGLKAFLKTFPTKMKPTKCPAREKKWGNKSEKRGEDRKRKVKVKTAVSLFNPQTTRTLLVALSLACLEISFVVKGAGAVILLFRLDNKTSVICHNVNTVLKK